MAVAWERCKLPGCTGAALAPGIYCLADLNPEPLAAELERIGAEGTVDARGVTVTPELLAQLIAAMPREDDHPAVGTARFEQATFEPGCAFDGLVFTGQARFDGATFLGEASFVGAVFGHDADFTGATFEAASFRDARFRREARLSATTFRGRTLFHRADFAQRADFFDATFEGSAWFSEARIADAANFSRSSFRAEALFLAARFGGAASFLSTTFAGLAQFSSVTVGGWADFADATFRDEVDFDGMACEQAMFERVTFERASELGPLLATKVLLDETTFSQRIHIDLAAASLCARRAHFPAGARLRVRWATIALDDADLAAPASLFGVPAPFPGLDEGDAARRWERLPPGPRSERWRPRLLSLRRTDVAGLRVSQVDLRPCRFEGAQNLDRLRVEGDPLFTGTAGWWRARRRTLAEEQAWRAARPGRRGRAGWYPTACWPPATEEATPGSPCGASRPPSPPSARSGSTRPAPWSTSSGRPRPPPAWSGCWRASASAPARPRHCCAAPTGR
jgi:uncharacterized protein YjbI with pentapeptide repeats